MLICIIDGTKERLNAHPTSLHFPLLVSKTLSFKTSDQLVLISMFGAIFRSQRGDIYQHRVNSGVRLRGRLPGASFLFFCPPTCLPSHMAVAPSNPGVAAFFLIIAVSSLPFRDSLLNCCQHCFWPSLIYHLAKIFIFFELEKKIFFSMD